MTSRQQHIKFGRIVCMCICWFEVLLFHCFVSVFVCLFKQSASWAPNLICGNDVHCLEYFSWKIRIKGSSAFVLKIYKFIKLNTVLKDFFKHALRLSTCSIQYNKFELKNLFIFYAKYCTAGTNIYVGTRSFFVKIFVNFAWPRPETSYINTK